MDSKITSGASPWPSSPWPSPWVERFAPLIRPQGPVLDVACGGGRHCRLFLDRGHPVTGVDRTLGPLPPQVEAVVADLEDGSPWPFHGRLFAGIVMTHYFWRPLFPALLASLEEDGVLICEVFAEGNEHFGRPRNPDFLARRGALLTLLPGLSVVAFEEGIEGGARVLQRVCAVKGLAPRAL